MFLDKKNRALSASHRITTHGGAKYQLHGQISLIIILILMSFSLRLSHLSQLLAALSARFLSFNIQTAIVWLV